MDGAGGLDRTWHVLLIGGASGVGKSELAAALARGHEVGTAEIDDLLTAIRAVTDPTTHSTLHQQVPGTASVDSIVRGQITTAQALNPAVRAVVDTHLDHGPPVIMEGDYLLPSIADGQQDWKAVRVAFVTEHDEDRIAANLALREPHRSDHRARAHVSWLYGEHLRRAALARGIPVLQARPWATQLVRLTALLATT